MPLRAVISARDDAREAISARTSALSSAGKVRADLTAQAPLRLSCIESISPQFKGATSVGGGSSGGGRGSSGGGRCRPLRSRKRLTRAWLCTSASTQRGAIADARHSAVANILLIIQCWCRTHVRGTAFVSEACALCLMSLQVVKVADDRLRAGLEDMLRRCSSCCGSSVLGAVADPGHRVASHLHETVQMRSLYFRHVLASAGNLGKWGGRGRKYSRP
jgi:hypothetical protein